MKRIVYSIDPGLEGTGWAEWKSKRCPSRVGVIPAVRRPDNLAARCRIIASELRTIMRDGGPLQDTTRVFIEMPIMMTSAAGIAAQKGSIYKLTFLVGYLAACVHPCQVIDVSPMEWKGQLPKEVVASRVRTTLTDAVCQELNIRSHGWDAVGLGLWANGIWR